MMKARCRIWLAGKDGTILGKGRADLLLQIEQQGSIAQAAKVLKMSYKKAWDLVNAMNRQAPQPLVVPEVGGKGGGGSTLTPFGRKMIRIFRELSDNCAEFLDNELRIAMIKADSEN